MWLETLGPIPGGTGRGGIQVTSGEWQSPVKRRVYHTLAIF